MQIIRQQRWWLICILQAGWDSASPPSLPSSGPAICHLGWRAFGCSRGPGEAAVICWPTRASHVRPGTAPQPPDCPCPVPDWGGGTPTPRLALPSARPWMAPQPLDRPCPEHDQGQCRKPLISPALCATWGSTPTPRSALP
uniref:Secreted protein n=1 Tax=Myotis myotis TaxID=51298 RepID=A0A7J7QTY9_MYOMY|nr:hypothetical protein mMyoMyo1_011570 [Myotis myotis]